MNNDFENDDTAPDEQSGAPRPLGYWLRLVDGLISREFATAFEGEGVTRRDWMLLGALSGDVDAPGLADRLARKGGKRLRRLDQLGWAEEQGDGTWALTDAGRAAKDRLGEAVSGIRSRVADAVSPEDYATMTASLEAIARNLGWDETQPFPRGRGFGPARFGRSDRFGGRGRFGGPGAFGPGFGFAPGHADAHGEDGCRGHDARAMRERWHAHGGSLHDDDGRGHPAHPGHAPHHGHGHAPHHGHEHAHVGHSHHGHHGHHGHGRRAARKAERAYERGFAAGFGAARPESASSTPDPAPAG